MTPYTQGPEVIVTPPLPPVPPTPPAPPDIFIDPGMFNPAPFGPPDWIPMIVIAFFVMVAFIAVGVPIARAIARRMDRPPLAPQLPGDTGARLERIEQAVEAMAVEVERISEGQRFITKLMSEARLPAGAAGTAPRLEERR
jgi:hypothetical protein